MAIVGIQPIQTQRLTRHWLTSDRGNFDDFISQVNQGTVLDEWPFATAVRENVLVYAGDMVRQAAKDSDERRLLMSEWVEVFCSGPGIIVIENAFDNLRVIDDANVLFETIISEQRNNSDGGGDHFAKPGANDRIWNVLEKHCLRNPRNFIAYYSNCVIAMACEAWLGRGYQVTAQVNRVNPGGAAQVGHRDYHLGFMSPRQMAEFPAHVHRLSPALTLQGAIAHCDMPIETGPTTYLPYSQLFEYGYLAFSRPEFQEYFIHHHIQLRLNKGDAVFFNPALMHAAGANLTNDKFRVANLLQVSSAMGRAMESVDRSCMVSTLYPLLAEAREKGLNPMALENVISASAEGYAFPTSLDTDPAMEGLAPESQQSIMLRALKEGSDTADFLSQISRQSIRRAGPVRIETT